MLSPEEAASDVAFRARGSVATAHHPTDGSTLQLAPLFAGAERRTTYELPDQTTTDTAAVLSAAGFATEEIDALVQQGVIQ